MEPNEEIIQAIDFYVDSVNGSSLDIDDHVHLIFDEDTLKEFIDDGHVIIINIGKYGDINDPIVCRHHIQS